MKQNSVKNRKNERGSAGAKMIAVLAVLFMIGHAGINFIPIAYQGASFKEEMQKAVIQGSALPTGGNPIALTEEKIKRSAESNNVPSDVFIQVKQIKGGLQARAVYTQKVNILPFGLYAYNYQFDHSASPAGFLMK